MITCQELKRSRWGNNDGIRSTYNVQHKVCGTQNRFLAIQTSALKLPPEVITDQVVLNQVTMPAAENLPGKSCDCWRIHWRYHHADNSQQAQNNICEIGDFTFRFAVRGEVIRLLESFWTKSCYAKPIPGSAGDPIYALVLEDNPDGMLIGKGCDLVGCEIINPVKEYKENHCFDGLDITAESCKQLSEVVGSVNEFTYRGFGPCELLLTSIIGNRIGVGEKWNVEFCWAISPSEILCKRFIGGEKKEIFKAGWDKYFPNYECKEDAETGEVSRVLTRVDIHQVYQKQDFFATLGV